MMPGRLRKAGSAPETSRQRKRFFTNMCAGRPAMERQALRETCALPVRGHPAPTLCLRAHAGDRTRARPRGGRCVGAVRLGRHAEGGAAQASAQPGGAPSAPPYRTEHQGSRFSDRRQPRARCRALRLRAHGSRRPQPWSATGYDEQLRTCSTIGRRANVTENCTISWIWIRAAPSRAIQCTALVT